MRDEQPRPRPKPAPKQKAKRRVGKSERRRLEYALDVAVSQFVRERDGKCVLCGSTEQLCAMHWVKRGKKQLRWNVRNVACGCASCNFKDNIYHEPYTAWMLKRYGKETVLKLIERSKINGFKYGIPELREMLAERQQALERR